MSNTNTNRGLIRMVLMGMAFIGLTLVLILFQPGSPRHVTQRTEPESSVTRSAPAQLDPVVARESIASASTHTVQPASMRDLTYGAISNLKSVTTGEQPAPGQPGSLLHSVVQRSLGDASQVPLHMIAPIPTSGKAVSSTYLVQPGDTLVGIARHLYGDVNMASEIFLRNTRVMARPDSLRAGMVLELPSP